jgi:hypothetical protein
MTLRFHPLPPVPDVTAAAVRAAFPKGNLYVDLRAEFNSLHDDQLFADLYSPEGRPVEVAPESPRGLRDLPALEALRRLWLQPYYRCTVPGLEALRWRTRDEQPPSALLIHSPYDLEARYRSTRDAHWVGYKVHLTETCDANQPDLMTQVITTPATTQDSVMGPAIQQD